MVITIRKTLDTGEVGRVCGNLSFRAVNAHTQCRVGGTACSGLSIDTPTQCRVGCLTGTGFSIDTPTQRRVSGFTVGDFLGKVIGQYFVCRFALGGFHFEGGIQPGVTGDALVLFALQRIIDSDDCLGFPARGR